MDAASPISFIPPVAMESPCVGTCMLTADRQHCVGCGRTVLEIGRWTSGTPEWRATVMAELPARLAQLGMR